MEQTLNQDLSLTARMPVIGREQPKVSAPAEKPAQPAAPSRDWQKELGAYARAAREWGRIHFRRWVHLFHGASAGTLAVGPVSFLLVAGALGTALTLTTLY